MPCKIYVFTKPRATTFYNNINYVISAIKGYKILNILWHWLLILCRLIIGHVWLLTYRLWHILCVKMCAEIMQSQNPTMIQTYILQLLYSYPQLSTWSYKLIIIWVYNATIPWFRLWLKKYIKPNNSSWGSFKFKIWLVVSFCTPSVDLGFYIKSYEYILP